MMLERTVLIEVPRLIVDGVPGVVDSIKPNSPGHSDVFVDGHARCHLLPDWFLPGIATPCGTIRTSGHTFKWEHTK